MPRKSKTKNEPRQFYASHPWRCEPRGGDCALLAFVEASGDWETVALVKKTSAASAEAVAGYIAGLVNDLYKERPLLDAARSALEAVLEEGLNYSTEQDADIVLRRMKERGVCAGGKKAS